MKKALLKILILLMLTFSFSDNLLSRYGIGYSFFGRIVAKKVYMSERRNYLRNLPLRVKSKKALNFIKDFDMILSKRGIRSYSGIRSFIKRVSHPLMTTKIKRVLRIRGVFKGSWNNYVELRPKNILFLPKWTKSIDFWAFGNKKNLKVYIYLSTKPGSVRRILLGSLDYYLWKKLYANIFPVNFKNERKIRLVKLRIVAHRYQNFDEFLTYFAGLKVYNYNKSKKNLYLNPVYNLLSLKNYTANRWRYQIGENESATDFSSISPDSNSERESLRIKIDADVHKSLDCFVFFKKPSYMLKGYKISVWLKGLNNMEILSLIFRDGKKRLFEVELARISFTGWRRAELIIDNKFYLKRGSYIRTPYVTLWGIKISSHSGNKIDFKLSDIKAFKDFRFVN
jgi:hypothetical protein